jgi:hypothetical protein
MPLQLIFFLFLLASCARAPVNLEPAFKEPVHPKQIQREQRSLVLLPENFSVNPFDPLNEEEKSTTWGKEYALGLFFAQDFDLYRAITCFKTALFYNPPEERQYEIQYSTLLAYFLGKKYKEVIFIAESTPLGGVSAHFPAFRDLVLILHESYMQEGRIQHALNLAKMLDDSDQSKLALYLNVKSAHIENLVACADDKPYLSKMVEGYKAEKKSIRTAECLNAILPGAGYWYVGQKQTAVTAFLVNGLFTGATAYFFADGNIPAGLILLSLESGWYFGGIYGGGLAAKAYNERVYLNYANKIGEKEQFYPQLMLKYSF